MADECSRWLILARTMGMGTSLHRSPTCSRHVDFTSAKPTQIYPEEIGRPPALGPPCVTIDSCHVGMMECIGDAIEIVVEVLAVMEIEKPILLWEVWTDEVCKQHNVVFLDTYA